MIAQNDRVRFIDEDKNKQFGVLLVFNIKGDYATIGKGDYASLGENLMTVKLTELKRAE
jgi:hypothetical protein